MYIITVLNKHRKSIHFLVGINLRTVCREAGAPITWVLKAGEGEEAGEGGGRRVCEAGNRLLSGGQRLRFDSMDLRCPSQP